MAQCPIRSIVPILVSGVLLAPPAFAQVIYSENFRSPTMPGTDGVTPCDTGAGGAGTYEFPAGWLLRNVDNRAPNVAVAYINDAWEVREDFGSAGGTTNCVAFSTSWYTPAGAANDFMWSPSIAVPASGAALSWRARAYDAMYPDGYEVRIMPGASGPPTGGTGVIGNQISASTVVFSTPAEQTTWITRTVDLAAYAGQNIYVGFRNNDTDQFILVIDDVSVVLTAPDVAASAANPILPYVRVPTALAYTPDLSVRALNAGGVALNNVTATAQLVHDSVDSGSPVASSAAVASLALGASAPVPFAAPAATLDSPGTWTVRYTVAAAQAEAPAAQANNTITSAGVEVGGTDLARHEGSPSSALGIGAGNGGELGVQFTLPSALTVAGVRFDMAAKEEMVDDGMGGMRPSTWAGQPITANLRAFDTTNNRPGDLIDTTEPGITAFAPTSYSLAFIGGPQHLAAGTYVVTVVEPIFAEFGEDATIQVNMHTDRFQTGTAWVNWPTSPTGNWANVETFGANFARTPAISLATSIDLLKDGFEAPPPPAVSAFSEPTRSATRRKPDVLPSLRLAEPGYR